MLSVFDFKLDRQDNVISVTLRHKPTSFCRGRIFVGILCISARDELDAFVLVKKWIELGKPKDKSNQWQIEGADQ